MTIKDIGAILYMYYIDNYCEDEFSFDNGETLNKVKSHYEKITEQYGEDIIEKIENEIEFEELEGTDYDWMMFYLDKVSNLFLQVTCMFDYSGEPATGYTGDYDWVDVGMFFLNNKNIAFEDLPTKEVKI